MELTAETIEHLLHVKLNGVIDVSFKGFRDVVDTLGMRVRERGPPLPAPRAKTTEPANYSSINLQPGYQKLCYENALSYVRYRHGDSDFVRVARQQDFLRNLREQVPVGNLVGEIDKVSKAVGKAVTSTFHSSAGQLIELAKLAAFSQQKPLRQVKFQVENVNAMIGGGSYVTSYPSLIKATVKEFLHGHEQLKLPCSSSSSSHSPPSHSASPSSASLDLYPSLELCQGDGGYRRTERAVPARVPLRCRPGPRFPRKSTCTRSKTSTSTCTTPTWPYGKQDGLGGYYDVEGMDWVNIPLFAHATAQKIGGRKYLLVDDGSHIHDIGWRTGKVIYFVSNTLLEDLSNSQMIAIARATQPCIERSWSPRIQRDPKVHYLRQLACATSSERCRYGRVERRVDERIGVRVLGAWDGADLPRLERLAGRPAPRWWRGRIAAMLDLVETLDLLGDQLGVVDNLDFGCAQMRARVRGRAAARGTRRRCW